MSTGTAASPFLTATLRHVGMVCWFYRGRVHKSGSTAETSQWYTEPSSSASRQRTAESGVWLEWLERNTPAPWIRGTLISMTHKAQSVNQRLWTTSPRGQWGGGLCTPELREDSTGPKNAHVPVTFTWGREGDAKTCALGGTGNFMRCQLLGG